LGSKFIPQGLRGAKSWPVPILRPKGWRQVMGSAGSQTVWSGWDLDMEVLLTTVRHIGEDLWN
jgi:hypothetical protein